MIYFVVFVLLLIPVVKYDWMVKPGGEKGWYYFNLMVLILFAGLRYRVGGDTLMYIWMFEDCPKLDELRYFDFSTAKYNPLWYILNAVSRSIYDDFTTFQIIHAIIVNVSFFRFFRKFCPNYYFSAILLYYVGYFCSFNMEILRESLCVCILLWATSFLLEKKWVPYYLMCVVALFMHYSSLFMFILPLLFLFKKPSWKLEVLLVVAIIFAFRVVNIPVLLLKLLGVNDQLTALVESYVEDQHNIMGVLGQIIKFLPILGLVWLREMNRVKVRYDFTFMVMGAAIVYGFSMNIWVFERFINYFVPFILIFTTNTLYYIISYMKRKVTWNNVVLVATIAALFFNYSFYYMKDLSDIYPNTRFYAIFYPYHSVLKPKQDQHREKFIEHYRDVTIAF